MTRQLVAGLAIALLLSIPVAADKVTLKDGRVYEGKLVREGATEITLAVVILGKTVEMTVPLDQVETFERTSSLLEQYEAKAARVDRKDPDALVDLAAWCCDRKLPGQAAKHLLEALALKPEHEKAAKRIQDMGYVREGKTWVPKAPPEKKSAGGDGAQESPAASKSLQEEIEKAQRDLEASDARLTKLESDLNAAEKKLAAARTPQETESAQKEIERIVGEFESTLQDCASRLQELEKLERRQQQESAPPTPSPPKPPANQHP